MDRAITASEANQRFSEMLREVAAGESFTVTSRGRPVARVVPVNDDDRQQRIDRALKYVRNRPIRYSGDWKREDLYE